MEIIINSLVVITAFVCMECVAWFSHKFIMHGFLWNLHKDHHEKKTTGFFESNDFFFLIFSVPGILSILYGVQHNFNFIFWIGVGISVYGITYFLVHDVFIHQRLKIFRNIDNSYFVAIRRVHKMHHKKIGKEHGEFFGMLWIPFKYFKN